MSTEKIMEQAQVFASAWSVVGGPFDDGDAMEVATQDKAELKRMVGVLAAERDAHAYIRAHVTSNPEQIDEDRPPGVKNTDWDSYNSPAKYRIAEVLGKADQPLLTMPIAEQSRVCRSTAGRILRIMELMGEARNVGVKTKAKWERV